MPSKGAAAEQAQALRALADEIEREDSPLPPDVFATLVPVADDAEWIAELRRRAASSRSISLEETLRVARGESSSRSR